MVDSIVSLRKHDTTLSLAVAREACYLEKELQKAWICEMIKKA
jgi:hypothetical protein